MAIIITYDIPMKHQEFKNAMFQLGYSDRTLDSLSRTVYLPNTTLIHNTKTCIQAREDAQTVCRRLNIDLERCVSTIWAEWAAILGTPTK